MNILLNAEKQGGPVQIGGWQKDMARRRYQRGSIRKRGKRQPIWELQWYEDYIKPDGAIGRKRESTVLGFVRDMTRRQAFKAADEKLRPLNQGKAVPHSTLLFRAFVEAYFIPNAFPVLKASTRKRYACTLAVHLLPAFGDRRLCDISTLDLQSFVLKKFDSGLGWGMCDHLRNLMSKIYASARKWGYFQGDNPATAVELPEQKPVHEKHVLLPDQIRHLLIVLREPVRTMVLLDILTGLRVGEILGLRWKDLDFASGQLRVEQAVYRGLQGSPKTKGSRRTLPLPRTLTGVLARLQAASGRQGGDELVFQTRNGTPFSDTNLLLRELKPAGQKIGAPWLNWHTLRRTHATLLQAAGGSLKDAQAQLGHSQLSTTLQVYTLPMPAHQREAVEKLSRMVTNGDEFQADAEERKDPVLSIQ